METSTMKPRFEFIIRGYSPNADRIWGEEVLHTKAATLEEARAIAHILTAKHGCEVTRIETIDNSEPMECPSKIWRRVVR